MTRMRRIGVIVVAGSMMLPLAGCSRTSDGTIVMDRPVTLPTLTLPSAEPLVPSWMKRKPEPEPVSVAQNFPPPPEKKKAPPRRKTQPPVVATGSGNLACKNVSEGGRVRMICE